MSETNERNEPEVINQCCQQRKRNERNAAAPIRYNAATRTNFFQRYPTILINRTMRNFQYNLRELNGKQRRFTINSARGTKK